MARTWRLKPDCGPHIHCRRVPVRIGTYDDTNFLTARGCLLAMTQQPRNSLARALDMKHRVGASQCIQTYASKQRAGCKYPSRGWVTQYEVPSLNTSSSWKTGACCVTGENARSTAAGKRVLPSDNLACKEHDSPSCSHGYAAYTSIPRTLRDMLARDQHTPS